MTGLPLTEGLGESPCVTIGSCISAKDCYQQCQTNGYAQGGVCIISTCCCSNNSKGSQPWI